MLFNMETIKILNPEKSSGWRNLHFGKSCIFLLVLLTSKQRIKEKLVKEWLFISGIS